MPIKIMLDAGHYGSYNKSPVYPQYYESKQMWKLHLLLKKHLENYGFDVLQTRSNQAKDLAVTARGKLAKGCDLFLSLHSDASRSATVNRATVFYAYDDWNNASVLAKQLAAAIGGCMGVEGKTKTRKSEKGDWEYYGVLRGARASGCPLYYIIEHSFHTNKASAAWLMSDSNLDKLAKAEAEVIAAYYGMKKEEPKKEEPKKETTTAYTQKQFVKDVQKAIGAAVDGLAGNETIGKTVTLSATKNRTHAAVKPVQKMLYALGYTEVGKADGIAGAKFTAAVKRYQREVVGMKNPDGEITAQKKTWRKLLKMK